MTVTKTNKYYILLLGYLVVLGSYFGGRIYQYLSGEVAGGEVTAILWQNFTIKTPSSNGMSGDGHYQYQCPEIHFFYKPSATDTGNLYIVKPQALSHKQYKAGEKTSVIFPKGHPDLATIYSLREFWFTTPYMIILAVIIFLWSIGFFVVVFKPWKQMDE